MLKWAVNQPRPSYLGDVPIFGSGYHVATPSPSASSTASSTPILNSTPLTQRVKLKRHSLLLLPPRGKENQLTSTPLPAASAALRDLSNILSPLQAPSSTTTPTLNHVKPKVYASTLPTFEAEYSPSYRTGAPDIIPGPLLALRGMGIPDSYFEKPRYLQQQQQQQTHLPPSNPPPVAPPMEQTTLSSSQMGDVTLERMIDAILESTRKPPAGGAGGTGIGATRNRSRRRSGAAARQRLHQRTQQRLLSTGATHSPTYRPAFDPASDLCEYWQPQPQTQQAADAVTPQEPLGYEEREVRSPQSEVGQLQVKPRSLQLRRQRVVRRKRKITTKISSSVRQSAQKLLAAASRSAQKLPRSRSTQRHISPDSGHNSTSDCELEEELDLTGGQQLGGEELEVSCQLDGIWMHSDGRDVTKRRLSFSPSEDN